MLRGVCSLSAACRHLRPAGLARARLPPAAAAAGGASLLPLLRARSLSVVAFEAAAPVEPLPSSTLQLQVPRGSGPLALNQIRDNYGARHNFQRIGRGIGSGRGRSSGRGQKGEKARRGNHGLSKRDGGQTKLQKGVPKMGYWRPLREYAYIDLWRIQEALARGRLVAPADRPISAKDLFDARLVTLRTRHAGVQLRAPLPSDHPRARPFDMPIDIEVQLAEPGAIAAIEAAGGTVQAVYYSRVTLRALLKPEKFDQPGAKAGTNKKGSRGRLLPRPALPPPKLQRDVYSSKALRGYLADLEVGDIVRPQDHPPHADLSMRQKPRYPGWKAAEDAAKAAGAPYFRDDGSVVRKGDDDYDPPDRAY